MIDLAALRQDPDAFKKSQAARGESVELVDQVITADAARRTALGEFESLRANQKAIGTQVAKAQGDAKQALFNSQRSAAFTANSLTQVVNGIYRNAGFDGASSHSGRRGFLTNLAEKGVSVRVMMALAGHANMATTQRYIDLRPGVLRNAVELV